MDKHIIIVGAGIGGLTAALALARRGARVTVLERAPDLTEVGAGLQISPNGGRVLAALGLSEALDAISLPSRGVELWNGESGRRVARLDFPRRRPDQPFRMIHRARLIEILGAAATAAGARVETGVTVTKLTAATPPRLDLADGTTRGADLIIGADGLRAVTRDAIGQASAPRFTGQTAWRALIPDPDGAPPLAQVFMGRGRHLVSYPLAGGLRNIVAVEERDDWTAEGWSHRDDPDHLRRAFAGFAAPVPGWLSQVGECGLWGLFRHPVAAAWYGPGLALLGDAVHPTLPFLAQGAVMAIEDAWVLADCLDRDPDQNTALARYQARRLPRTRRIVRAANGNARAYHLSGLTRMIGHAGLRLMNTIPGALEARFNWLYDFDPTA
ncbi:FAD-dependent oxidoreductase [Paracoccus pacificus]|uniref:FAD-dependent oxidoreductase n=1 Tax=Paracoccus pacificus TaxID=1463598 RepID=A0ABW4R2A8_9RHOB